MFDLVFIFFSNKTLILFFLAFLPGLAHFLAEPCRWFIYTKKISGNSFKKYFYIFSFTALASYLLPFKLGLPFRIFLLQKMENLTAGLVMAILAVDGLIYYAGWGIAALLGIIYGASAYLSSQKFGVIFGLLIICAIILPLFFYKISEYFPDKISSKLGNIKQTLSVVRNLSISQYIFNFLIVISDIFSQIFRHYVIFMFLGAFISLTHVAIIVCISIFAGIISMMPMGLVGYDATLILLSQKFGVSLEQALLIPLINRFISLSLSTILGIWGGLKLGYNPFKGIKKISSMLTSSQ